MELVILSGMSGAGKSTAAHSLEDLGYYCIDNLPLPLLERVMRGLPRMEREGTLWTSRLCLVMDSRSWGDMDLFLDFLSEYKKEVPELRILYMEASEPVILSRYKQSRRNHPLAKEGMLLEAIRREKDFLAPIRNMATDIVDTSHLAIRQTFTLLAELFETPAEGPEMGVFIRSFGFKYGIPLDCDLVMDVRFLRDPFYVPELRPLSGQDAAARDYIFDSEETRAFFSRLVEDLEFLLPLYQREGKRRLNIGIGCTGGRHRSVAVSEALAETLEAEGLKVFLFHRDIEKDLEERR